MKKIILSILCLVPLAGVMSCTDYLDVENKTSTNADGFVDSYDKAFSLLATCYAKLGTNNDGIMGNERFRMATDLFESWGVFQSFEWDANDTEVVKPIWRKYYKFIADANNAIQTIESYSDVINKTFSESAIESSSLISALSADKNFSASDMLLAEAKTLRAYAYFTLYRYYGGVPIIDKLQTDGATFIPRASRDELFAFIENDLRFAIAKCADSKDGTLYGRISKSSAAGLLAKCLVFQASYIRRAGLYAGQLGEEKSSLDVNTLYSKAVSLCDTLINKKIGASELTPYYPAVFKTRNNEMLICFDGKDAKGQGARYSSSWGIGGNSNFGATGSNSTSMHPIMYDFEMWKHNGSARELFKWYGAISYRNFGEAKGNAYDEFKELGCFTHTGDTTRRMWNTAKLYITGPTTPNLPAGLWCFEPMGRTLGPEFFIDPGRGEANYTETEKDIIQYATTGKGWNDTRWYNCDVYSQDAYSVGVWWRFAKFRTDLPQTIDYTTIDYSNLDNQIPILRLGEIYLLKAEAKYFLGDNAGAIAAVNQIRDRACNQATMRDMYLNWDKAEYKHLTNSVEPVPADLSGTTLLLEILWERARELCGEDTCRWFDIARFPDLLAEVYETMEEYADPLHKVGWYWQKYMSGRISKDKVYRVLLPIPATEFQYFPELGQNPGY